MDLFSLIPSDTCRNNWSKIEYLTFLSFEFICMLWLQTREWWKKGKSLLPSEVISPFAYRSPLSPGDLVHLKIYHAELKSSWELIKWKTYCSSRQSWDNTHTETSKCLGMVLDCAMMRTRQLGNWNVVIKRVKKADWKQKKMLSKIKQHSGTEVLMNFINCLEMSITASFLFPDFLLRLIVKYCHCIQEKYDLKM